MKDTSKIALPLGGLMILGFMAAGCNQGNGIAGGGDRTADFYSEVEAFQMKLDACAPGADFLNWNTPGDSLPILDGLDALMAVELADLIEYANYMLSCDDFFAAINSDQPAGTCDTPGNTCEGTVINACLPTDDGNALVTLDCSRMGLECYDGRCTLGLCSTDKCEDGSVVSCDDLGFRHEFRCDALGLDCGYGVDSFQCTGTGDQCSTTTISPSCTGDILTWCLGGKLATLDCAAITGSRRECNQSWIDANTDVTPLEMITDFLDKVCSPTYPECANDVSMCDSGAAYFCRDGLFEEVYCPNYGFEGCTDTGDGVEQATCTGFPAAALTSGASD